MIHREKAERFSELITSRVSNLHGSLIHLPELGKAVAVADTLTFIHGENTRVDVEIKLGRAWKSGSVGVKMFNTVVLKGWANFMDDGSLDAWDIIPVLSMEEFSMLGRCAGMGHLPDLKFGQEIHVRSRVAELAWGIIKGAVYEVTAPVGEVK